MADTVEGGIQNGVTVKVEPVPIYMKKNRSVNWTEREKVLLVQGVLERETYLFGRNKGGSREVVTRHKSWTELQESLNAQLDIPRSVDQMRKAFENIKSRAKLKVEQLRDANAAVNYHPLSNSPSIQLLIDRLLDPATNQDFTGSTPLVGRLGDMKDTSLHNKIGPYGSLPVSEDGDSNFTDKGSSGDGLDEVTVTDDKTSELKTTDTPTSQKRQMLEDELLEYKVKKIKAEIDKLEAETKLVNSRQLQEQELFEARKKQEEEIFVLKKQLINAKIDHLSEIGDFT